MSMLHVLHYSLLRDWVLLYVPNGELFSNYRKSSIKRRPRLSVSFGCNAALNRDIHQTQIIDPQN